MVVLPDLRGTGETRSGGVPRQGKCDTNHSVYAQLFGETLLGQRLRDLRSVLAYLRARSDVDGKRIALWGDSFAPPNDPEDQLQGAARGRGLAGPVRTAGRSARLARGIVRRRHPGRVRRRRPGQLSLRADAFRRADSSRRRRARRPDRRRPVRPGRSPGAAARCASKEWSIISTACSPRLTCKRRMPRRWLFMGPARGSVLAMGAYLPAIGLSCS